MTETFPNAMPPPTFPHSRDGLLGTRRRWLASIALAATSAATRRCFAAPGASSAGSNRGSGGTIPITSAMRCSTSARSCNTRGIIRGSRGCFRRPCGGPTTSGCCISLTTSRFCIRSGLSIPASRRRMPAAASGLACTPAATGRAAPAKTSTRSTRSAGCRSASRPTATTASARRSLAGRRSCWRRRRATADRSGLGGVARATTDARERETAAAAG